MPSFEEPAAGVRPLADMQGDVVHRYRKKKHARYVFAKVTRSSQTRAWLKQRLDEGAFTTNGSYDSTSSRATLNAAFSYQGLVRLGVPEMRISHLTAFREDMERRAARLGDVCESRPECWEEGMRGSDMLLVLTAQHEQDVKRAEEDLRETVAASRGIEVTYTAPCATLHEGGEHFGFRDGFSEPAIEGVKTGPVKGEGVLMRWGRWRRLALGEFVLGHRDEGGLYSPAPLGPLGSAATFMVVRRLQQDVWGFRKYTAEQGDRLKQTTEWVQAKMIGRWRSGTALAVNPFEAEERPGEEQLEAGHVHPNDFRYADDPYGLRCPLGAHVRRAFPRDSLGWQGRLTERHRIIRRGIPYGPVAPQKAEEDTCEDRGLMFVCYQASIERQFEFIQQQWLGDGNAFKLGRERDPLTSPGGGEGQMIVIATRRESPERSPEFLAGIPSFVTTRGGGYYLLPGGAGLQALAGGAC